VNQTYRVTRDWEQSQQQNPSNNHKQSQNRRLAVTAGPTDPYDAKSPYSVNAQASYWCARKACSSPA
jgi:hypothetical protein